MDNFRVIYRILRHLERSMDCDELDTEQLSQSALGVSQQRLTAIWEMLSDENYVQGVRVTRSADGFCDISFSNLRITLKGLEYLQSNSIMQKCKDIAKGIIPLVR